MKQIQDKVEVLELLELDLIEKIRDAVTAAGLGSAIHGVFSLDDLEKKTEGSLNGRVAFGVAYQGITPVTEHKELNVAKGNAAAMADFIFAVLVAAPVDTLCSQRITATRLLTILRNGILGKSVNAGEPQGRNSVARAWNFVQEKPEIGESSETMLYYTQVWRLVLPMKGNL